MTTTGNLNLIYSKQKIGSREAQRMSFGTTPSTKANPSQGQQKLQAGLRSVLSNPLGLPMVCVFNDIEPSVANDGTTLPFCKLLKETSDLVDVETKQLFNQVLKEGVISGFKRAQKGNIKRIEPLIVKDIEIYYNRIRKQIGKSFFSAKAEYTAKHISKVGDGRLDILLTDKKVTKASKKITPLMVIEFGRKGEEWWTKFDQLVQYIDLISDPKPNQVVVFERPLLMSVVTIDDKKDGSYFVKIGVFLCRPSQTVEETMNNKRRITPLWHNVSNNLQDASNAFGKLLEATAHFQKWVKRDLAKEFQYEYFSSNCCRMGDRVSNRSC
jgi:hypothetical protein